MARTNTLISARNLADLITAVNAFLAPLLSHQIVQAAYTVVDEAGVLGQEYTLSLQVETGGSVMTDPYVMAQFGGDNPVETMAAFIDFVSNNPALFISQPRYWPFTTERRRTRLFPIVSFSCVDAANGLTNWLADGGGSGGGGGGGAPTGPAGGDLGGTYPNPSVFVGQLTAAPGATTTTLDAAAVASFKTIVWEFEAIKGTNTYSSRIAASHDGTTPVPIETDIVLAPDNGTFDVTAAVDISGANMRLRITTASAGWSLRARRISELSV